MYLFMYDILVLGVFGAVLAATAAAAAATAIPRSHLMTGNFQVLQMIVRTNERFQQV